jgi:hypothetical protein
MKSTLPLILGILWSLVAFGGTAAADKRLQGIACRSVHLSYAGVPDGSVFYNEVRVAESAPGTYFCVCGFSRGYYGIQELANGRKLLIFSVWDPGQQDDPEAVDPAKRVQLLHQHADVRVGRFGNEGTGGQSFYDFDWKQDTTLKFAVAGRRVGNRTQFAAFFLNPDVSEWMHLVTFSTLTPDRNLRGYYAFVEDFRRNRVSTTKTRRASFPNGWVMTPDRMWHALDRARFTADSNPVTNIRAGVNDNTFYLATGGQLSNDDAELQSIMRRDTSGDHPPELANTVIFEWLESEKQPAGSSAADPN